MNKAEAAAWLQAQTQVIILIHQSPDGDCIGSGYALAAMLRLMGKHAVVRCCDPILPRFSFLIEDEVPDVVDEEHATVMTVDVADRKLLGDLDAVYGDRVQLAIDHHRTHCPFATELCLDAEAASACEIVYEIGRLLPISLTTQIVKRLYTGMATDTGCFQYSNTTPRTLRHVADLMEQFPDVPYDKINRAMFVVKSMQRLHLEQELMQQLQSYLDGKCMVICITLAFLEANHLQPEDAEGWANFPLQIEGVEVGITIKEREPGVFKISMRSTDQVDVSAICQQFGGGGHVRAAGCRIEGTVETVRQQLVDAVERSLATQ
jgi:phosphoesterase RecJ-like protein